MLDVYHVNHVHHQHLVEQHEHLELFYVYFEYDDVEHEHHFEYEHDDELADEPAVRGGAVTPGALAFQHRKVGGLCGKLTVVPELITDT